MSSADTADVVLVQDSPLKVAEAIEIAQKTRQIVWQNIGFVFLIKGPRIDTERVLPLVNLMEKRAGTLKLGILMGTSFMEM